MVAVDTHYNGRSTLDTVPPMSSCWDISQSTQRDPWRQLGPGNTVWREALTILRAHTTHAHGQQKGISEL